MMRAQPLTPGDLMDAVHMDLEGARRVDRHQDDVAALQLDRSRRLPLALVRTVARLSVVVFAADAERA
eukprot:1246022-Prymnesium_polylepis.2